MPPVKLSLLATVLGLLMALIGAYGVLKPAGFAAAARRFPRYTPIGYVFMIGATAWFLVNLSHESISDFASFKPLLYGLFVIVGLGACVFVRDFLPVRGLAVLYLLAAKLMVDSARWVDTEWRLVIVTWAYVWILAGMWFTVSPWRLRDLLQWSVANPGRTRLVSAARLGFGLFVLVLGLITYRAAEKRKPGINEFLQQQDARAVAAQVLA